MLPINLKTYARSAALAATLALGYSAPVIARDGERGYLGLGQETCRQYLQDISSDHDVAELYTAWLAGFFDVASAQLSTALYIEEASDSRAATDWVVNYCARRGSDTFMTAAVKLLIARENR